MPLVEFTALLVLATAMSFTPGPNTTLSTALAANRGLPAAMRFVLSVPVGWSALLLLCAGGLGALVLALPALRWAIKAVGIGYLLWLALRLSRTGALSQADAARLRCDDELHLALVEYITSAQTALLERIYGTPPIIEYDFAGGVSTLVAAHEIYRDARRAHEIEARNPSAFPWALGPTVAALAADRPAI